MSIDAMKEALEALERAAIFLRTAIAEAEKQEPVCEYCGGDRFTTPPAAQRQPLTDGEMHTAYITATDQTLRPQDVRLAFAFARAIEAAHGIGGKA